MSPSSDSITGRCLAASLSAVLAAIGAMPVALRSKLGWALGRAFSAIPTRDRTIARLQITTALGAGASRYIPGVYGNLGRCVLESLNLSPLLSRSDALFREADPEFISRMLHTERPIVALTAHFGNWDLLAALMAKRGFKLSVIGREARNPALQEVLRNLRERYGVKVIWRTEGPRGAREILGALKSGGVVAALIDQDTRVAGQMIPFFGLPAHTPHTLLELAARFNAHVVGAVLRRDARGLGGEILTRELDTSASAAQVLAQYHAFLEEAIRSAPDQWVWLHKRWRTLPSGERLSSKEYLSFLQGLRFAGA